SPKGDIVRIKDIAEVKREYDTETSYVQVNGKNALVLSIEMLNGNNIVEFGKKTDEIVKKLKETMPEDIDIVKIADMPSVVKDSVGHFFRDFAMAIISVIIVIMIFLPKRAAAVAAMTIPISILMSMALLEICGVQLNTVSLAALVMVLGMIVDNSIVVIDNHIEKLDEGITLWQAAWSSASELAVPVFTATLAIVCTFATMPIFMNGIYKEFCMPVPITVAITLFISLIVAVLLVPGMQYSFIKKGVKRETKDKKSKKNMLETLQDNYDVWLEKAMKKPSRAIFISALCIIAGMALLAMLPRQLFPKLERNQFAVEIYFPEGTSLQENEKISKTMAETLRQDKRVKNVVSFIGTSSPRFHSLYAPQIPANNYSQLIVNTSSYDTAKEILKEYGPKYKDLYPNAHIKWKELDFLPVEAPIEVRISGDDIPSVKDFAAKVSAIMREEKDLAWVRDNYRNPLLAAELDINREAADRLGITSGMLALSVALNRNGMPLANIYDGDYARPVILKYADTQNAGTAALPDQHIYAPLASSPVMLRQIAKIKPSYSSGQVVRRNGRHTITVMADMSFGKLAEPSFRRISRKVDALSKPAGISIEYGGEQEKTIETYIPFTKSLVASVLLIFIILLLQFKKVRPALTVMATMPFSLIGGAAGLAVLGYPFGMTSFIGFIGLFGIVTRNGVIMITYAQELEAKGMSVHDAAIAAGKRRMRPIFLTASAAAVGVIPLITSGSSLWGPLGTVICFGLVSSTWLTLYALPAAYWKFNEK
ncbi:MAG: efflux RND transporter permease subunit, partial [Elusimicrobiales bacterium]|nr:efflux RND transporter permease subunit [Elusimicrobiales bacterium]